MKLTKKQLRIFLVWRIVELIFTLLLIGVVAVVSQQIQSVRRTVAVERLTLESSLRGAVQIGALRTEMFKRQHDIDRITAMVPDRNSIGEVVGVLEFEAERHGVEVTVPNIDRVMGMDKDGKDAPLPGLLQDIDLTVQAIGPPGNLIRFFNAVENAPFLVGVTDFELGSKRRIVNRSSRLSPISSLDKETEEVIEPEITLHFNLRLSSYDVAGDN